MKRSIILLAVAGVALTIWHTGCSRQTVSTIGLAPELQEIAALAQNHTRDENIIGYIRNSGKAYKVTANDIVILTKNGVSQNVIAVLMQSATPSPAPVVATAPAAPVTPAPPAAPVAPAAAPAPVVITVNNTTTTPAAPVAAIAPSAPGAMPVGAPAQVLPEPPASPEYFEAQLAPYGEWVYLPEFGTRCWLPVGLPPGWRPYFDSGHWLYTDSGMYWQSDYPWGAIPFHYGRWINPGGRWVWVPAYEYAPAWVIWRHSESHMGWAPVPPGAAFVSGGWQFHGRSVAVDFDFGLAPTLFVFVGHDHFLEHDFHRHELHGEEWHRVFARSEMNHFVHDEHGHGFRVEGFERPHVELIVGHKVEIVRHDDVRVHALENLHKNAAPQPKPVPAPKVTPPAASGASAPHPHAEPPAPVVAPVAHPHAEPPAPATATPKVTPVSQAETHPHDIPAKAATPQPAAVATTPRVTSLTQAEVRPRVEPQSAGAATPQPAAEARELPVQRHLDSIGRGPAREEKTGHAGGKAAAVDNSASTNSTDKAGPTELRPRRHEAGL